MSPEKFLDLITSNSLYFAPCNIFDDLLEGTCTRYDLKYLISVAPGVKKDYCYHVEKSKRFTAINCWHMNNTESLNMWNNYTAKGKGVVIQSTYNRLSKSLEETTQDIFIGQVDYINHDTDQALTSGNEILRFFKKDRSFAYEQELRAIKWLPKQRDGRFDYSNLPARKDYVTAVNLETLIEAIVMSPSMEPWLYDSLKKVTGIFLPDIPVISSALVKKPPHLSPIA